MITQFFLPEETLIACPEGLALDPEGNCGPVEVGCPPPGMPPYSMMDSEIAVDGSPGMEDITDAMHDGVIPPLPPGVMPIMPPGVSNGSGSGAAGTDPSMPTLGMPVPEMSTPEMPMPLPADEADMGMTEPGMPGEVQPLPVDTDAGGADSAPPMPLPPQPPVMEEPIEVDPPVKPEPLPAPEPVIDPEYMEDAQTGSYPASGSMDSEMTLGDGGPAMMEIIGLDDILFEEGSFDEGDLVGDDPVEPVEDNFTEESTDEMITIETTY